MTDYPKIDDKVILRKDFKDSDDYNEYFGKGELDELLGKECIVCGLAHYPNNRKTVDITTKDADWVFRVGLEWVEAVEPGRKTQNETVEIDQTGRGGSVTNIERIRRMSPEELAEEIAGKIDCDLDGRCPVVDEAGLDECMGCRTSCLVWLETEAKDG